MTKIDTTALLTGPKEAIVAILSRVYSMTEMRGCIRANDSIETLNGKIQKANDYISQFITGFTLVDFLDDRNRMECPYEDWVLSYVDDDEPDGSEDFDAHIIGVTGTDDSCTLKVESYALESQRTYTPEDWQDWSARMESIYGISVELTQEVD